MKREIPPAVFVVAIIVVLGVVGYFFYRSNRTPQGAGVTKEELRREFMQRAQSGQLPISPEQLKKMQQAQPK
jgi:Tfp pilus assembly protein PilO